MVYKVHSEAKKSMMFRKCSVDNSVSESLRIADSIESREQCVNRGEICAAMAPQTPCCESTENDVGRVRGLAGDGRCGGGSGIGRRFASSKESRIGGAVVPCHPTALSHAVP
jgi:hypothetical protein